MTIRKAVYMGRRTLVGDICGYAFKVEGEEMPSYFQKRLGYPLVGQTVELNEVKPGSFSYQGEGDGPNIDSETLNTWEAESIVALRRDRERKFNAKLKNRKSRFEACVQPLAVLYKACHWTDRPAFVQAISHELDRAIREIERKG